MKILNAAKNIIYNASLTFTLITVGFFTVSQSASKENTSMILSNFKLILVILLFSFLLSLTGELCKLLKINVIITRSIHFVLSFISFYLSFFVLTGKAGEISQFLFLSIAFIVIYALIGSARLYVNYLREKKNRKFISIYDTPKDDDK